MKHTQAVKANNDKTVGVLVDAVLYRKIVEASGKENRSVSQWIRLLLERTLGAKA